MKKTHLGRVEGKKVVSLEFRKSQPYGIKPRNAGQYFLQEALMKSAEKAPLVIVKGMAGTAKTLLLTGSRTGEGAEQSDRRI